MLPSVSPSKPPPRTVFSLRQERLASYAYAMLRSMELEACWIADTPSCADKVVLGTKLGVDGAHLGRLVARMSEMFFRDVTPSAPAAYEENFTRAVELVDIGERKAFLVALSRDVIASVDAYIAAERQGCADEPSVLLLGAMRQEMDSLSQRLAANSAARTPFDIVSLEAVLGTSVSGYTAKEPIPLLVPFPAREERMKFAEEAAPAKGRKGNPFAKEALRAFFHNMYIDVEIPATEVCARMIVEYRDMPIAFKVDMSRQAWDEARHAVMTLEAMRWAGAEPGEFPYHAAVWRRYMQGADLGERIAIQQLVQEGNSCDKAVTAARALRGVGHTEIADIMDQIIADEVVHVRFGNRWVQHLTGGEQSAYDAVVAAAQAKIDFPLGPVNEMVRQMEEFPRPYIIELRKKFERMVAGTT